MFKMLRRPLCQEVEKFTYDYLNEKLDPLTQKAVSLHLKSCNNCQNFVASYKKVKEEATLPSPPPLDSDLKEMMYQFLRKKIKST